MVDAIALALPMVGAYPIALLLLTRTQALFATGLIAGVTSTLAATVHVLVDVPIVWCWAVLVVLSWATIAVVPVLRRRVVAHATTAATRTEWIQLAIVAFAVIVVVALPPAPLGWDARSIWLFHASWLNAPASAYIDAQSLDAVGFSHPNYPFLGPSAAAVSWGIAGGAENLTLGVQVTAFISILVAALAGSLLVSAFGRATNPIISAVGFALFLTAALRIADGTLDYGYMDALQAAFIACLVAALLPSMHRQLTLPEAALASVIGLGAINVKQEGFWFALIVVLVAGAITVRDQYLLKYLPLAALVVGTFGWRVFLMVIGSSDQTDASGSAERLPELLDPSSVAWSIVAKIAAEFLPPFFSAVILLALLILAVVVVLPGTRHHIREVLMLALPIVGISALIILTYALGESRDRIDWWLATSFTRIFSTVEYLGWLAVLFALLAASPWRSSDVADLREPARGAAL